MADNGELPMTEAQEVGTPRASSESVVPTVAVPQEQAAPAPSDPFDVSWVTTVSIKASGADPDIKLVIP